MAGRHRDQMTAGATIERSQAGGRFFTGSRGGAAGVPRHYARRYGGNNLRSRRAESGEQQRSGGTIHPWMVGGGALELEGGVVSLDRLTFRHAGRVFGGGGLWISQLFLWYGPAAFAGDPTQPTPKPPITPPGGSVTAGPKCFTFLFGQASMLGRWKFDNQGWPTSPARPLSS